MRKLRYFVFLIAATFFLVPSAASAQAMKLLTRNSGWLLLYGRLYWTNDFGHDWRNITPPGSQIYGPYMISGVFFLNAWDGWALLVRRSSIATGTFDDALAETHDAGTTWSVTPLHVASPHPGSMPLAGGGTVFFRDRAHGWIDFGVVSSLAVMHGLLFSTGDGGATWHLVRGAPQIAGSVRFATLKDGWLAGGPTAGDLYSTHDGGRAWARVVLRAPSQQGARTWSSYSPPSFSNANHGVIVVSNPWSTALTLFATTDGGRSWEPVAALTHLPSIGTIPATTADSHLITAWLSHRRSIKLTVASQHNQKCAVEGPVSPEAHLGAVTWLSFRDTRIGWVLAGKLYATADGGRTWTDISPKAPRAPVHTATPQKGKRSKNSRG